MLESHGTYSFPYPPVYTTSYTCLVRHHVCVLHNSYYLPCVNTCDATYLAAVGYCNVHVSLQWNLDYTSPRLCQDLYFMTNWRGDRKTLVEICSLLLTSIMWGNFTPTPPCMTRSIRIQWGLVGTASFFCCAGMRRGRHENTELRTSVFSCRPPVSF